MKHKILKQIDLVYIILCTLLLTSTIVKNYGNITSLKYNLTEMITIIFVYIGFVIINFNNLKNITDERVSLIHSRVGDITYTLLIVGVVIISTIPKFDLYIMPITKVLFFISIIMSYMYCLIFSIIKRTS